MSNQQYSLNNAFQNYQRQISSQNQNTSEQISSQSSTYTNQMANSNINLMKTFVPQTQSSVENNDSNISQVIKYLRKNGYFETVDTLLFEMAENDRKSKRGSLESEMTDSEVENLINFTKKIDKIGTQVISEKYSKFRNWVLNSLSSVREELISVCFVVFMNICSILYKNSSDEQYNDFLNKFADDFSFSKYREIIKSLKNSNNLGQLRNSELLKPFFGSRFHIILNPLSISSLNNFLISCCDTLISGIMQEKLTIHVLDNNSHNGNVASTSGADDLDCLKEIRNFQIGELYSENSLLIEFNSKNNQKVNACNDISVITKDTPKVLETDMSGKGYSQDNSIINWGLPPENYSGIISKENEVKKSKFNRFDNEITEEIKNTIEIDFNPINDLNNSFTFRYKKHLYEEISNRKFVDSTHLPSIICSSLECPNKNEIIDMNISHNHEFGAFCTDDGCIQIFDIENQKSKIEPVWIHRNRVQCIRFHPWSQEFLLSGGIDSIIKLSIITKDQEEPTLNQLVTFTGHSTNSCIWDLGWDEYGISFISGSSDRTARLWCTSRTYPIRIFTGHLGDVRSVSIHPNSSMTVTGGSDNQIIIWDVRTGKKEGVIHNQKVMSGIINQVKFSHNGYLLASSSIRNQISHFYSQSQLTLPIWDIRKLCNSNRATKFYQLCKFPNEVLDCKEQIFVKSLDFSFGSRIIASSTNNGIVSIWDTNVETSFNQVDNSNSEINSLQIYKLKNSSTKNLKFLSRNLLSVSSVNL
ncbi:transcription initiation factor TFIID subunit [Cryptosporidium ubiquitum]|uniref:Transcription initiation factor TFIID subunit n=1 Tax=Cryptosporidium ubiquitum TaxID=857276 RepID=A0A1J4MKZ6_9CRYT|nr:transcription initiation factor TFIID subunit [Cryptosporidium ubiquitum]OII74703.1 transcription initiation factor TFIID subunit [Cryptosporidium ubiquitum]